MSKNQVRIVLNAKDKPLVEEIKQTTGVGSLSEVVTLLVRRYGAHFVEWFQSNPHRHELSMPIAEVSNQSVPMEVDRGNNLPPLSELL